MQAAMASAAPSGRPREGRRIARARTVPSASVTSTAILVPPTSTPTRRSWRVPGRWTSPGVGAQRAAVAARRRRVAWHAALAHRCTVRPSSSVRSSAQAPRSDSVVAGAAVDDARLARERAERAARRPRRASASNQGRRGRSTLPWTTMRRDVERADEARDRRSRAPGPRRGPIVERALVAGLRERRREALGERAVDARRPAARRARRIAGALATVSRQPNRPQWHGAPSGSTTMWPISPAP